MGSFARFLTSTPMSWVRFAILPCIAHLRPPPISHMPAVSPSLVSRAAPRHEICRVQAARVNLSPVFLTGTTVSFLQIRRFVTNSKIGIVTRDSSYCGRVSVEIGVMDGRSKRWSLRSTDSQTELEASDGNSTAAVNPLDPLVEQAYPTVYVKGSVAWPNTLGLKSGTDSRILMASDSSAPAL
jgi:hypothetical protein